MKTTVTIVLLTFVAASAVFLAVDESNTSPADPPQLRAEAPAVIAYYFHGTARCPTCLRMENWAREAVEQRFAAEVKARNVRWLAVNYDEPANEHFVKRYSLSASAVVLASQGDADQSGWRNLTRIWDLAGDEAEFKTYVANELADLLKGES